MSLERERTSAADLTEFWQELDEALRAEPEVPVIGSGLGPAVGIELRLLQKYRIRARVRLHEMGAALGLSAAHASEMERGVRPMPRSVATRWTEVVRDALPAALDAQQATGGALVGEG